MLNFKNRGLNGQMEMEMEMENWDKSQADGLQAEKVSQCYRNLKLA